MTRPAMICCCLALLTAAVAQDRTATVTVHPEQVVGKVNPLIFGNNQLDYQGSPEYGLYGAGLWDPDKREPVPQYVAMSRLGGVTVQRWPGGCTAHTYNWKLTVGPLSERPNMQFGLPEFMKFTEASGAVALLTLAVYWGNEQDGADIVEYLNAPNNGNNPNGGTDWAAVRAADGHPAPYGVVYFEYGNEDYHGEHKTKDNPNPRKITAEDYAAQYLKYQRAMKRVDPKIQLGGLLQNGLWDWNKTVLQSCGKQMDFAIEHTYIPGYNSDDDRVSARLCTQAAVASDTAIQRIYDRLLAQIREVTGRTDLKLAITEYNGWFVQEKPFPYRQCLANALRNAEHLRVMMQPRNHILMANFWQFSNEYWGMVRGFVTRGETPVPQANFFPYQLYHEHFGDTLVQAEVQCQTWDFPGAVGVPKRAGKPAEYKLWEANLLPQSYEWLLQDAEAGATQQAEGGVMAVEFAGKDTNYYAARVNLPAEPDMGYRVTGEIKTENLQDAQGAGFQVGDGRGWVATKSCALGGEVRGTQDWTPVVIEYSTLSDTTSLDIIARRLGGKGNVSGKVWYRVKSVQKFRPANAGAVPDLGVNSATRRDGTVTVMIVNRNLDEAVPVKLTVAGRKLAAGRVRAWLLSGPAPTANNLKDPKTVGLSHLPVAVQDGTGRLTLPACSMAAVEIRR